MRKSFFIPVALVSAFTLRAQEAKFAIERIALHQFEDGPVLAQNYEFVPGETVYFSCRMTGYRVQKKDEEQSVKISWEMRTLDPAGVPIDKDKSGRIEDKLLPQDKKWMPKFLDTFAVPPFAPTGTYKIPVKIKDEIAGAEVDTELTFRVHGREVQPSETLIARNFQFLRNENDQVAMRNAVYHPGEMLWARFDITGYKFGEKNRFSVDYGLAILNGEEKELFSQPVAASESSEAFYPQRYVPGMLSLSLDPNVPKGNYLLVVTVHDKAGEQSWETRQPFLIE